MNITHDQQRAEAEAQLQAQANGYQPGITKEELEAAVPPPPNEPEGETPPEIKGRFIMITAITERLDLDLEELKLYLKVDHIDDDAHIADILAAAKMQADLFCQNPFTHIADLNRRRNGRSYSSKM